MIEDTHSEIKTKDNSPVISKYRFETIVTKNKSEKSEFTRSYIREVEIIFIAKVGSLLRYQILCMNIIFKTEKNPLPSEFIIRRVSYIFDEVSVSVNREGKIVELHNLNEIRKRWIIAETALREENSGVVIDNYFKSIDKLLKNEGEVISFLNNYKMYGLYFHGYYGEYDNRGLNHKKVTDLDFLEDYTIEETIHISHKKDDNNTITELKITGNFINTPEQIKKYDGELYYKNNRLEEGIITIEHEDTQIKYNVLWVG